MEHVTETMTEFIPIREISRVTGVNTVTLRAWERRYGLLVPHRTPKGHRLYTQNDIRRVEKIQQWLARGVAISKIGSLLASNLALPQHENQGAEAHSVWREIALQMHDAIDKFQRSRLEHLLSEALALYPSDLVADNILLPLLENLRGNVLGMGAKLFFFISVLYEFLHAAVHRQRQAAREGNLLILTASSGAQPELLLLEHSLAMRQHQTTLLPWVDVKEALIAAQALEPDAIVFAGFEAPSVHAIKTQLALLLEKQSAPVVVAGSIATLVPALNFPNDKVKFFGVSMQQICSAVGNLISTRRGDDDASLVST